MIKMAGKVVGWIGAILLIAALLALPGAFLLMIILGALSHVMHVEVLAISFWASYLITILFSLFFTGSSKS